MLQYLKYLTTVLLKPETVSYSPVHIQLEPTNYCNLKCKMCIRDNSVVDNKNMSFEEYKNIIDQIKPSKVTFAGAGEPTINKGLLKMIKYSADKNCFTMIASNATLLNNGSAQPLIESGLNVIKISIDAAASQTYMKIRGEDCFDDIVSGIENINRAKKKLNKNNPQLRFDYVLLKDNIEEVSAVLHLAKRLGMDTVYFRPLQKVGLKDDVQKKLTENFDLKKLNSGLKRAKKLAQELNISTNLSGIIKNIQYFNDLYELKLPDTKKICLLPWLQTFVAANGDVAPCCALYFNEKFSLGNIFRDGFKNIWNGEGYKNVRKRFKNHKKFKICLDCDPRDIGALLSMARFLPDFIKNKE